MLCAGALGAATLAGCASTVQDQPIPHNILESVISAPFPVYWLGGKFDGLQVSEVAHDPAGAYTLQYGDCMQAGQGTCVPPLRIVTSPDNSFLPGDGTPRRTTRIRGVRAVIAQQDKTILIPTGNVVIDIFAANPRTAAAAARIAVPINQIAAPEAPLPAALPNTGFGERAMRSQEPPPLRPIG